MEGAPAEVELSADAGGAGEEAVIVPVEAEAGDAPALEGTVEELIISANAHFEAAEAAQRDGDWTTYGEELEALQRDLNQLSQLTNDSP